MNIFLSKRMRYFIVTMERRCFTKAANDLCITRSPLSKQISELEYLLGNKLFVRNYNELKPTLFAEELYKKIKPLQSEIILIEKELSEHL